MAGSFSGASFAALLRSKSSTSSPGASPTEPVEPTPSLAPSSGQRQHDKQVADDILKFINQRLSTPAYIENKERAASVRVAVAEAMVPEDSQSKEAHFVNKHIALRLKAAIEFLSDSERYRNAKSLERKRFLGQCLSDPELGNEDPVITLIAKELGLDLRTYRRFAEERREHGLGWCPAPLKKQTITQEWKEVMWLQPANLLLLLYPSHKCPPPSLLNMPRTLLDIVSYFISFSPVAYFPCTTSQAREQVMHFSGMKDRYAHTPLFLVY
jgi:hypothetical protein